MRTSIIPALLITGIFISSPVLSGEDKPIPRYEEYLKESDLTGFLRDSKSYLKKYPEAIESPRLVLDYLMVAKAARDLSSINDATSKLLFNYPRSLPSLHFISSFVNNPKAFTDLLVSKANQGKLESKEFAVAYCRALLLGARNIGAQVLSDSSLRLRAYLLARKAEVEEIESSAAKALDVELQRDNGFAKIAKIIRSESSTVEKISALSAYSGKDAEFATAFYLAQLTEEERKSTSIIIIQLRQALFGKPKNIEQAITSIARLPSKIAAQADVQTFLALAQLLDGKSDLAIQTLSKIPTSSKNKVMEQWGKTAQSFANGIQYRENRTKAVLKAVGEAMDQMEGYSTLYVEIEWKDDSVEPANTIRAQVGVSTIGNHLEIHVQKGGIPIFAYRTVEDKSSLFSTELNKSISFQTPGVFPVPKFDVQRDVETGGFAYNFNLNFSTTQDKLIDEGIKILESPYLGTSKGREVFLNYLLSEKGLWISPAKNITGGTSFPLSMLNPENPVPTSVNLTIDLSRKLRSLQIGSFFISNFSQGDATVMKKLPSWPSAEQSKEEKFDFNLLMKLIQNLMGNTK
jgi:hypothetical protein